jgi:membrane protein involved in colicin uptake
MALCPGGEPDPAVPVLLPAGPNQLTAGGLQQAGAGSGPHLSKGGASTNADLYASFTHQFYSSFYNLFQFDLNTCSRKVNYSTTTTFKDLNDSIGTPRRKLAEFLATHSQNSTEITRNG